MCLQTTEKKDLLKYLFGNDIAKVPEERILSAFKNYAW